MKTQKATIQFLGAAGTVTGSKTLLTFKGKNYLIDCGLFQGLKELREKNWEPFPIPAKSIDEIILTHAHLDHCGYLPSLVRQGFRGKIHCTVPTKELSNIILMDSAKIQEEDANRANKYHYSRHETAKPLYTIDHVFKTMPLFEEHELHEWVLLDNDLSFQFINAGHILGSAMVDMKIDDKKVIFSGDIGRKSPMLLYPPKKVESADYLILESTYGDRLHPEVDVKTDLLKVIEECYHERGILMIPTFAVERTQEIIYLLNQLADDDLLPNIPIYLDSPMGIDSTNVYMNHHDWQNISRYEMKDLYSNVKFISSQEESKLIVADSKPKIILAGSGMIEGGRILHYLSHQAHLEKNTLLFVGFQSEGTRGKDILEGAKEIKFFGEMHPIKCKIRSIQSLSGHADQNELISWFSNFKKLPKTVFLNHGEQSQRLILKEKMLDKFSVNIELPEQNSSYELL